jgi:hypothetical protein
MSDKSASERLHNLCAALEQDLNESPFTREEWERMDAERLELLKANDSLRSRLAAAEGLLREARDLLDRDSSSNWLNVPWSPLVRSIDAHLAGAGEATP